MTHSEETIMAYVDGELDPAAHDAIATAALTDGDLADRIAAQRALRERLRTHFAPVTAEPVPEAWIDTIRAGTTPATVIDLAQARAARAAPRPVWTRAWVGGALAASLVMGLFIGTRIAPSGPIVAQGGALLASGDLAHTLDTRLASTQGESPIRILASFRRDDGTLCRAFSGAAASGIACHDGAAWRLQHVLPGTTPGAGAYRQAASPDGALMALAQTMAAGDPLDAAQERAAMAEGWRAHPAHAGQ